MRTVEIAHPHPWLTPALETLGLPTARTLFFQIEPGKRPVVRLAFAPTDEQMIAVGKVMAEYSCAAVSVKLGADTSLTPADALLTEIRDVLIGVRDALNVTGDSIPVEVL